MLEIPRLTGAPAMLSILNVFLAGTLDTLNDDPRLRAVAADALAEVAEATRLLDRANAAIAKVL